MCIGDRYRIGESLFEVTQPRVTCYRVGIRMDEPQMAALLTSSGKPGFYFRVLQEGEVEAGDEIVKVADGPERMTVAEINALLYLPGHSRQQLERALRVPALSAGWRTSFQAFLQQESSGGPVTGNPGLGPSSGRLPRGRAFVRSEFLASTKRVAACSHWYSCPWIDVLLSLPSPASSSSCACGRHQTRHRCCAVTRSPTRQVQIITG